MSKRDVVLRIGVECCRVLLGGVFVFSGFVKAVDPMGGAIKMGEYLASFSLDVLQPLAVVLAFGLAAVEFALGMCLLLGVYRRYVSFLLLVFMAFMTPLTLYLALFDPVSDCGCFGDAWVITNWQTFGKNVVLSLAVGVVFWYNRWLFPFFSYRVYWFVALYVYLAAVGFALYNYNHLPVIDFRPYRVGANIPELMRVPEGAPEDEYVYSFVYEKEGVRRVFSLEDYPANDSSWTFVESRTELVKRGFRPVIDAFSVYDGDGNDVTDVCVLGADVVFLLVAPDLRGADDGHSDEVNGVYDFACERLIPFYCVTGSTGDVIEEWSDRTGAEYPFLMADEVLLKTMVRANPGLVLLQRGTVLGKWHANDIPSEEALAEVMDGFLCGEGVKKKEDGAWVSNLWTFAVPLLLVGAYDWVRFRRRRLGV